MRGVEEAPSFELNAESKETKLRKKRRGGMYIVYHLNFFFSFSLKKLRGPEGGAEGCPEKGPEGGVQKGALGFIYTSS